MMDESSISELEYLLEQYGTFDIEDIDEAAYEVFGSEVKVRIQSPNKDNLYELKVTGFSTSILLEEEDNDTWRVSNV